MLNVLAERFLACQSNHGKRKEKEATIFSCDAIHQERSQSGAEKTVGEVLIRFFYLMYPPPRPAAAAAAVTLALMCQFVHGVSRQPVAAAVHFFFTAVPWTSHSLNTGFNGSTRMHLLVKGRLVADRLASGH